MTKDRRTRRKTEYGDFQTPAALAGEVCALLARTRRRPASIVEPTCGEGSFLMAAWEAFPNARRALGLEINGRHLRCAESRLRARGDRDRTQLLRADFFQADWTALLGELPEPILIIGNPPWVTNAALSAMRSSNLPKKSNSQGQRGVDALTGKSNFDISEWILIRLIEALGGRRATLAVLCKTAVARKAVLHAWKKQIPLKGSQIRLIDGGRHFAIAADACLLICDFARRRQESETAVFDKLDAAEPSRRIGIRNGQLVADLTAYERWGHLQGRSPYRWRSGIKHDCSRVMELVREGNRYRNGFGRLVELESDYLYPMLKSSGLASGTSRGLARWMLVTQRHIGDDTQVIRDKAPKTWRYLRRHADKLDARASAVYENRPRFSVFGVGDYSFATWKVAISGLAKSSEFVTLGQRHGKPTVVDDTVNLLACRSQRQAETITTLLNSEAGRGFFAAFTFWDAKRPMTIESLNKLDIIMLARELDVDWDRSSPQ